MIVCAIIVYGNMTIIDCLHVKLVEVIYCSFVLKSFDSCSFCDNRSVKICGTWKKSSTKHREVGAMSQDLHS